MHPTTTRSVATLIAVLGIAGQAAAADPMPAAASSTATPLEAVEVRAAAVGDASGIGVLSGTSWHRSPVSVHAIDQARLEDLQPHNLSEALRVDASVNDTYAPIGYYQNFNIRGFPLDLATGYRLNGLSIAGEQRMAFWNKQGVEVLKGLAGVDAGVVSPGGLINLVSKLPAEVRSVTAGTDARGSRMVAVDLGTWLTNNLGIRFNAAWDDIHSYVEHADGRRNFYSLALDWNLGGIATLYLDSGYQTSAQRSSSGYQPLGGSVVPDEVHPEWLLGYQPWQQPVGIRSLNNSARLAMRLGSRWKLHLAAGHSRSVIDDNVAFAWGCYSVPACAAGNLPGNAFAPDGSYDIYDFRSPDDTRRNSEARARLTGTLDTGGIGHTLVFGIDALRRTVDQRPWVYEFVGTGNIHQSEPPVYAPSPLQPGSSERLLSSWQRSLLALDRIAFSAHWQALIGTRLVHLDEQARADAGPRHTDLHHSLPQAALLWLPNEAWTAYASYAEGLSLGAEAPSWTSNGGTFLAPIESRQLEAGVKFSNRRGLEASLALFRIQRPFQFALADNSSAGFTFVQQGRQVHHGLELASHGHVTRKLRVDASIAWTRARLHDTGVPALGGHQAINIPELRSSLALDYQVDALPGLHVLAAWRHSGSRTAGMDGSIRVDGHDLFDAGLRYRMPSHSHDIVWRLYVSNLLDRFYWRDTGGNYGDYYLFPGMPRQVRLSAQWSF